MALNVAIGLVVLGACILAAALVLAGSSFTRQPSGHPRYSWVAMVALLFLFIVGYIGYASIRWGGDTPLSDLGVPLAFFGACLLLAVSTLAFTSMRSVHRLTVLEYENITDSLTGIPNYRYFAARLSQEVARSNRYQPPLSLILVDIDQFKKINDTYGYRVGDLVLIALAKLVLSIARDTDITTRYGREEIAVIAPNTSAADAARFAERLRQAVESSSLLPAEVSPGSNAVGVTVSIGVSSLGPHVRGARALIAGAYAALLNAKHAGRNRIAVS
jgi:diguanylate cyclase (GGDEF)-like protein